MWAGRGGSQQAKARFAARGTVVCSSPAAPLVHSRSRDFNIELGFGDFCLASNPDGRRFRHRIRLAGSETFFSPWPQRSSVCPAAAATISSSRCDPPSWFKIPLYVDRFPISTFLSPRRHSDICVALLRKSLSWSRHNRSIGSVLSHSRARRLSLSRPVRSSSSYEAYPLIIIDISCWTRLPDRFSSSTLLSLLH